MRITTLLGGLGHPVDLDRCVTCETGVAASAVP